MRHSRLPLWKGEGDVGIENDHRFMCPFVTCGPAGRDDADTIALSVCVIISTRSLWDTPLVMNLI